MLGLMPSSFWIPATGRPTPGRPVLLAAQGIRVIAGLVGWLPDGRPRAAARKWTQQKIVFGVPAMKKVFTTGQVAKICKVAPRTVSKWFDSGRLRGYRIPGSQDRRIPREYLIKFLKEHGMPVGDLEDEAMAKVLVVGQHQVLLEILKRQL